MISVSLPCVAKVSVNQKPRSVSLLCYCFKRFPNKCPSLVSYDIYSNDYTCLYTPLFDALPRLNRLEEAVSSYNDALRIDPFFVEAYNGRGNALMDFGHEDGTILGRRVLRYFLLFSQPSANMFT